MSLAAGAPQSFVQQVATAHVQRPVVLLPARAAFATDARARWRLPAARSRKYVTDRDGTIPGAVVRVVRNGTAAGQATTDAAGRYRISDLAPNDYDVTISMQNYKTVQWRGVAVSGGMETVLNATLQVGKVNKTVAVMASSDLVRADRPTVSQSVNADPIQTLPRLDAIEEVTLTTAERAAAGAAALAASPLTACKTRRRAMQSDATGANLGDLFSKLKEPVTIRKNQSALVPSRPGSGSRARLALDHRHPPGATAAPSG